MKDTRSVFEIIKKVPIFEALKENQKKKISKFFIKEYFSMGDHIVVGKVKTEYGRILISGNVRQIVEHPINKNIMTLNIEKHISYLGLANDDLINPFELVSAATDCFLLKIKIKDWEILLKEFPEIHLMLNECIRPSHVWPLINNRKDISIPEKPKDLKKWINLVLDKSEAITFYSENDFNKVLKDDKEWLLASTSDQLIQGEIFKKNILEKVNLQKNPLKIIGLPKNIFSNNINNQTIANEEYLPVINTKQKFVPKNEKTLNKKFQEKKEYFKFKFYGSSENKIEQAVACFRTIGDFFDLPLKADILKRNFLKNVENETDGVSLNLFAAISESNGLTTQLFELPINLLYRVETPAVLQLKDNELAVILDINKKNVLISRPRFDLKSYTKDDLKKLISSEEKLPILVLKSTDRTPKRKFGLKWFLPAIKKNKRPLIEVLIASLFVQVFQLMNPLIIQQIIDNVLGKGAIGSLGVLASLLFGFSIFENILTAVRTNLFIDTTNRIDISLGEQVIDHLLRLPLSFFDKRPVGELSTRLSELEQIRTFLTSTALTVVLDSVFSVVYIAVMLLYSWILTIVALLVAPILALLTFSVSPIVRRQLRTKAELNAKTQNHLVEVLTGIQTVKAQNFELKARWKWRDRYTRYITESFKNAITSTTYTSISQLLNQFSSLGVLCVGTFLVIRGDLTLGELIAFRIISGYVTGPLLRLSNLYQNFQQTNIAIERVSEIINTPQESNEKDSVNIPMPKIDGSIRFEELSFAFSEKGPLNLSKINLEIYKGKFVAIVG